VCFEPGDGEHSTGNRRRPPKDQLWREGVGNDGRFSIEAYPTPDLIGCEPAQREDGVGLAK
jgi:hypothetical protein